VKTKKDKEERAVKILDLRDADDPDVTSQRLERGANMEAKLWFTACLHKNIVQLDEIFHDASCCFFVMERCASSLFQHLAAIPDLNERSLGSIVAEMLDALSHVHSVGVVHRDVKPDNFLMGGQDGLTVKLADFGLSAVISKNSKLKAVYGTAPFMCPEMVKGKYCDEEADVWSVGVLAYALPFGNFPYVPKQKSSKGMKQAILEGRPPSFESGPPYVGLMRSCSAFEFLQNLLHRNPENRPYANEALQTPYMAVVGESQHMLGHDLPALRPMLYLAKKVGAFEVRDLTKQGDLDVVLHVLQKAKWGKALPVNNPQEESPWQSKASVKSNVWSTANSWNNATSLSTTASTNSETKASANSGMSSPPLSQMGSWSQASVRI